MNGHSWRLDKEEKYGPLRIALWISVFQSQLLELSSCKHLLHVDQQKCSYSSDKVMCCPENM